MSEVALRHRAEAPARLGIYVITCSTSKFKQMRAGQKVEDASGDIIEAMMKGAGHGVVGRALVSDERAMIRRELLKALRSRGVDAVIITGGTGIAPRDVTTEAVQNLLEKEIPGFGELLRKISYDKIGPAAMMSRAIAGIVKGKAVFCLPGSPDGVETALASLIIPEIGHIIRIARG